jgi:hypothetical protein
MPVVHSPNAPAPFSYYAFGLAGDRTVALEFIPVGLKFCPDCRQDLPLHAFEASYQMCDNLYYICRECKRERQRTQ